MKIINLFVIVMTFTLISGCSMESRVENQNNNSTQVQDSIPPTGAGVIISQASSDDPVVISWFSATDEITPSNELEYKLIASTTRKSIDTVEKAEEAEEAITLLDWTKGVTSVATTELESGTNYYFAVLVKDEKGNTSIYLEEGWVELGSPGFSAAEATNASIAIDGEDHVYVAYSQDTTEELFVKKYDYSSKSWQTLGGGAAVSSGWVITAKFAIDANGTPYVAYSSSADLYKPWVKRFDGTSWEVVGGGSVSSSSRTGFATFALDPNDNLPLLAYNDENSSYEVFIKKFDGESWNYVGAEEAVCGAQAYVLSLVVDSSSLPYLTCRTNLTPPVVKHFDGALWSTVGESTFSGGSAVSLLHSSGVLYMAYPDRNNSNKITVKKFTDAGWVNVGASSLSEGEGSYMSIAEGLNGEIYIVFKDAGDDGKAMLKVFRNGAWQTVQGKAVSDSASGYSVVAVDSYGQPYVAYMDVGANSGKLTVRKPGLTVPNFITTSECPYEDEFMCELWERGEL